MGGTGQSAGGAERVAQYRRQGGSHASAVPLSSGRQIQGHRQYRRRREFRLPRAVAELPEGLRRISEWTERGSTCYFRSMMKHLAVTIAVGLITVNVWAAGAQRAWQAGTWRGVQIVRPKIVFGVPRDPRVGSPAPAPTEVRSYVIETDDL